MSSLRTELNTEDIQGLIRKGLEKDIATYVTDELIKITEKQIKETIKAHVEKVVKNYVSTVTEMRRDTQFDQLMIHVEFRDTK